jgi:hypothetical protein
MRHSQDEIDLAAERIADGEQDLAEQRARIERQRAAGEPIGPSEQVLVLLESAVEMMKGRLATMLAENKLEKMKGD